MTMNAGSKLVHGCAMLFMSAAFAAPFAYVPNEGSGTVSVIDVASDAVVGEIPSGQKPRGIAANRDGSRLFVSDQPANALLVIDTAKRAIASRIALGESPEGVSISPDGELLAAASEVANAVILIDVRSASEIARVRTEGRNPEHAVFTPDSRWLFVSAEDAEQ